MQNQSCDDFVLAHLQWVRRLSVQLVHDVAVADDVVQEVWLAARGRAPRGGTDDPRGVRAWLGGIVRNVARRQARSEGRRRVREQAVAGARAQTADDLVERSEVLAHVAQLVLELDEPFRRTMLLRWFEGLSSAEIAESEAVPLDTVKSRLRRGRQRIRERLDIESGGESRSWALALVPLAARESTARAPLAGGLSKPAVVLAACAALVAGGAWSVFRSTADPSGPGAEVVMHLDAPQTTGLPAVVHRRRFVQGQAPAVAAEQEKRDELRIQVLEPSGAPGVGVELFLGRRNEWGRFSSLWVVATSDARGVARFDWLDVRRRTKTNAFIVARIAGREQPWVALEVAADGAPPAPLVLELPPTGSIVAHLVDATGVPIPGSFGAQLEADFPGRGVKPRVSADFEAGLVRFDHVALGESFRLRAEGTWTGSRLGLGWLAQGAPGPRRAGEVAELVVRSSEEVLLYTGTVRRPDGAPLASSDLNVRYEVANGFGEQVPSSRSVRTDRDGQFVLCFGTSRDRGQLMKPVEGQRLVLDVSGPQVGRVLRTTLELPPGQRGQRIDLGELTLFVPDRFVSGRVLDEQGVALAEANLTLLWRLDGKQVGSISIGAKSDGTFWLPNLVLPTPIAPDAVELWVGCDGYAQQSLSVGAAGAEGLVLELSPNGSLECELLLDPEFESVIGLDGYLLPADGERESRRFAIGQELLTNVYTANLPAGRWDFRVMARRFLGLTVHVVRGVEVRPGEPIADERLRRIDLRGKLEWMDVRVVDLEGQPVDDAEIYFPGAASEDEFVFTDGDGRARFVYRAGPAQVHVVASGYAELDTVLSGGASIVVLER